MVNKRKKTYLV